MLCHRPSAKTISAGPVHPDNPIAVYHSSEMALTSTLQSLANSIQAINARLQSLENTQASTSASAMFATLQTAVSHAVDPGTPAISTVSVHAIPQYSLAFLSLCPHVR